MNSAFLMDAAARTLRQMQEFVPATLLATWASLAVTYLLMAKGFLKYLVVWSKPVAARIGLPDAVIHASLVAFGSVLSANAMLSQLYHERQISEKETYLGAILNGASLNIRQIFTYQLPVIVPLLGWKAGGIYLLCFILTALMRYGFVWFHARSCHSSKRTACFPVERAAASPSWEQQLRLFAKITSTYLLVTFAFVFLFNAGIGVALQKMVAPVSQALQLPLVLAVPIAVFILNPIAGAAAIGTLQRSAAVSDVDAVLAVIIGSLLLLPLYGFRSGTLARTVSIFGARLGMRISATSTVLAVVPRLIFLVCIMGYKMGTR